MIARDQRVDEALAFALDRGAVVAAQRGLDAHGGFAEIEPVRHAELRDVVAAPIDFFACWRELVVVTETHASDLVLNPVQYTAPASRRDGGLLPQWLCRYTTRVRRPPC